MLSVRIALRYLFSCKSHSAVNVISMISMAGIAVAAMSMVCVLSVFNGFKDLAFSRLSALDPEVKVWARDGGVIYQADSLSRIVSSVVGVDSIRLVLEQRALAINDNGQMPVRVRGVQSGYDDVSELSSLVIDGVMADDGQLAEGDRNCALLSVGVAMNTGARPMDGRGLVLMAPRRLGRINPAFPMSAFRRDTLAVSGVYQSNEASYDEDLVYVPLESARRLFDYTDEATSLELSISDGYEADNVACNIAEKIGGDYVVADRLRQQEDSFRMIEVEKWITFLMLSFVLIMASFNVLSTMSMLIIEKEDNIRIMSYIGASDGVIRRIFLDEGMLIAVAGGIIGVILGIILCLLQQYCGLISLGGDAAQLSVAYYPCRLALGDVAVVSGIVMVIGFVSGLVSSRFFY